MRIDGSRSSRPPTTTIARNPLTAFSLCAIIMVLSLMAVRANRKPSNGIVTLVSHTDVWYTRVILPPPPEVYICYGIGNTIRSIGVIVASAKLHFTFFSLFSYLSHEKLEIRDKL